MAGNNAVRYDIEYNVISVEKTDPPEGVEGNNWYRYVIGRGTATMVGRRRGTLKQVTEHAKTLAKDLNERSGRTGKSLWAPRQSKSAS